jgi:hypothetical protein
MPEDHEGHEKPTTSATAPVSSASVSRIWRSVAEARATQSLNQSLPLGSHPLPSSSGPAGALAAWRSCGGAATLEA